MGKLQEIPGVGKNIEQDLINIGIREISDLKGKKPEELYLQDCLYKGFQEVNPRSHLYGLAIQDFPAHSQPIYTTLTPKSTTWSPDNKSQVGPVLPV